MRPAPPNHPKGRLPIQDDTANRNDLLNPDGNLAGKRTDF